MNKKTKDDPAWQLTKTLGIGLAEARARLAAEAEETEAGQANSEPSSDTPTQ